jgi:hypothetical protein
LFPAGAVSSASENGPVRGEPSGLSQRPPTRSAHVATWRWGNILRPRRNNRRGFHDSSLGGSTLSRPSLQDCFISPGRTGHPPRRPSFRKTRSASLGWSLVFPGGSVDEMDLDVTRFFKRLCSEGRRKSVHEVGNFRKPRPPAPNEGEAKDIIGSGCLVVLRSGHDFFFARLPYGRSRADGELAGTIKEKALYNSRIPGFWI